MKFIIKVLLFTVVFINSARAEWVEYAKNSDRSMILHYQNLSVGKKGEFTIVHIRKNFKSEKSVALENKKIVYKSVIDKQLIDCGKNLYRNTEVIFFEESDAKGKELYKSIIDKVRWHEVKSNSVQEELMTKVCFSV
jgi:5S rRNA maturation endonuclease (ribonuclease M5)